jgi:hypothetical protein
MPTTHYVYVNATNNDPFPPHLSDDENHSASTADGDKNMTTDVGPGDTVIWSKSGDITSLDNVFESGNGNDLFSTDPALQANGTWQGVIGTLEGDNIETYSITYTVNGQSHTQDPKISGNPNN